MTMPPSPTQANTRLSLRLTGLLLIFACCYCLFSAPATAHEIRPAIIDLRLNDGEYQLQIKLNLEARLAGIGAEHEDTDESAQADAYKQLRQLAPGALEQSWAKAAADFIVDLNLQFDGKKQPPKLNKITIPAVGNVDLARDSLLNFSGEIPTGSNTLNWSWPEHYGANILRISTPQQEDFYNAYLTAGKASDSITLNTASGISAPRSAWTVFKEYVIIGFQHIIPKGLDHILFVVGLFLLSASLSALLWQVTSFTLAHSVTLALGMLGWIQISPAIVEPLIAASIIYVCLENVFSERLSRWRPIVIFLFGLLHGLGFAGVLSEIGLSGEHFALGLVAFNVGVELGQLSVIVLCFLLVGLWFRKRSWYRKFITIPASLVIAGIGLYWFLERTVL